MALIKCPECGKEFSQYASACPNCACPTEVALKQVQKPVAPAKEKSKPAKVSAPNVACQMSFNFQDGVIKGFAADNIMTIPSSINGKKVKEIGYEAFKDCSFITGIIIEEGIEKISYNAFYGCDSVNQISIPNSIKFIDDCSLHFQSEVIKYNEYDNGLYLGNKNNPYLVLVKPKNNSISSCSIHKDCRFIYHDAFEHLEALNAISIPKNIEQIGCRAFQYCSSLKTVNLAEGLKTINADVFSDCTSLESINIPSSVTEIQNNAFRECSSLKKIIIPKGITYIGWGLFYECHSLEEVFIPKEVKSIGMAAFYNCRSLRKIYYAGTQTEWMSIKIDDLKNECLKRVEVVFSAK